MFSYVGGIYGYAEGNPSIENNFSMIDMDVYGGFVGGIGGQSTSAVYMRGNLSLGDVFIHSTSLESAHRLFGYLSSGIGDNYAFAGQMFLDGISDDKDDAKELLTKEQLTQEDIYTDKLKWNDSFAYTWIYNGESQSISQGYMPMLKGTDGSILPNQKPMQIGNTDASITEALMEINSDYVEDYHRLIDKGSVPSGLTNPYQLHFVLNFDSSKYSFDTAELSMDGMNLNTIVNGKNGYEESVMENRHVFNFHFVKEIFGGDIYCLKAKLTELSTGREIIVSSSVKPEIPISIRISNANEWNEKLKGENGTTYPNVVITGDIDFSKLTDADNVYNVKLNSLTSDGGMHTISGIDHVINGSRDVFIKEILSRTDNVKFDNIKWKVPEDPKAWAGSYTKIGIIGTNSGSISNVEFSNIDINAGVSDTTGCIGYNIGSLHDIKLKDIKIKSEGTNTGGLAGQTKYAVNRIQAQGTIRGKLGADDAKYGYEIVGRANVGGICGNGQANEAIDVNGIHVVGNGEWLKTTYTSISAIGGIVGTGNIPAAGSTPSEQKANGSRISNSVIETMNEKPEGTVSSVYGAVSGSSYYITADNLIVRSSRGDNVGGISSVAFYFTIKNSLIKGYKNVGGASGTGYAYSKGYVDSLWVEAFYENAGGVVGKSTSSVSNNIVDRTTVIAPISSGGIIGRNESSSLSGNLVSRSFIKTSSINAGGIVGADGGASTYSMYGNAVTGTTVEAGDDIDTKNSYAGGLIGYAPSTKTISRNFVRDSKITASGNCVGGLVGYSDGCQIESNYFADSAVNTGGAYAGGLIGRLDGDNIVKDVPTESKIYNSYVKGNIKAKSHAAGFIGYYSKNQNESSPAMDGSRVYSLMMLGNVESENNSDFIMNIDQALGYGHQEEYIRVYEHSKLITISEDGQKISEEAANNKYKDYWYSFKPKDAGGTAETGNEMLKKYLLVRNIDLHDGRLYSLNHEKGGLNWISYWSTVPAGRMDEEKESNTGAFPIEAANKNIKLTVDGKQIPLNTNLYDVGNKTVTAVIIKDDSDLFDNCEIRWYRSYGGRYDLIDLQMTDKESVELAGRGYYLARVYDKDTNKYYYSNIIKVQTKGYMPILTAGTECIRGIQEGMLPGIGDEDSLINEDESYNFYNGMDMLYYGGIEFPEAGASTLTLEAEAEEIRLRAYPSGIDTVNIELPKDYEDVQSISVYDGDNLSYSGKPLHRAISVKYGFKNKLTVKAESINTAEADIPVSSSNAYLGTTEEFDPSELRRTVMLWGDDYYYTCNGQLMNSHGIELDKDIIHLYKGQALDADGNVYRLSGVKNDNEVEADILSAETNDESKALFEGKYENKILNTYRDFTEIYEDASDNALIQEKQLLVKNDKLYSFENCDLSEGYVIDEYNGLVYASILNGKSELKDMADHIKTPDGFSRKNIAHMTANTDSELPYLIVRYKSGEAKGFNYITGEELDIENAFSDISLFDFALANLSELINPSQKENPEFAELRILEEKLNQNPIDEDELLKAEEILSNKAQDDEALESTSESEESGSDDNGLADKDGIADADGSSDKNEIAQPDNIENILEENIAGINNSMDENINTEAALDKNIKSEDTVEKEIQNTSESQAKDNHDTNESLSLDSNKQNQAVNESRPTADMTEDVQKPAQANSEAENKTDKTEEKINTASAKTEKYVYSFNAETGDTEIFNKIELLSKKSEELKSEQEKQQIIDAAGIYQEASVLNKTEDSMDINGGIYLFILAILSALGLTFVLVGKRK